MSDERYDVVITHPDDPVNIYDLSLPDEPCVAVCRNADEADAWINDHKEPGPGGQAGFAADPGRTWGDAV